MKQSELKKVVKYTISDTVRVCEVKAVRDLVKLVKADVARILDDTCAMLKEEGTNRHFYVWEYADADITFFDKFSAVVMVKAYGYGYDEKLHEYIIYSTVNDDLSICNSALVSVDGTAYSIGQYSL